MVEEKHAKEVKVPRLQTKYLNEIRTQLFEQFSYKSVMQVPKIMKITLNM